MNSRQLSQVRPWAEKMPKGVFLSQFRDPFEEFLSAVLRIEIKRHTLHQVHKLREVSIKSEKAVVRIRLGS